AHPTYYRLRQTDYNGNSETFKMINVNPCSKQTNWGLVAIQGQASTVRVTLQSSVSEIIDMEIFDLLGNKISETQIELFGGYQAEQLEVTNLLPGIYIGTAKSSSEMQTLKFVVKD
ncbi:MAG: T9SS type A sorting domain-containing protein, partial [Bacteroidia bacterium]|nr:T9SS type A sorting domain-containing protein [Bacteroidia bacterium]